MEGKILSSYYLNKIGLKITKCVFTKVPEGYRVIA